jgi:hypothetical protein
VFLTVDPRWIRKKFPKDEGQAAYHATYIVKYVSALVVAHAPGKVRGTA